MGVVVAASVTSAACAAPALLLGLSAFPCKAARILAERAEEGAAGVAAAAGVGCVLFKAAGCVVAAGAAATCVPFRAASCVLAGGAAAGAVVAGAPAGCVLVKAAGCCLLCADA